MSATPYYTKGEIDEHDRQRRLKAQQRKPLIAKWEPDLPTGYIHVDDAIEYMRRRWGKMLRAEVFERFSTDDGGPGYTIFGDWPDKSRGERYYAFDDIDMWVYRTITGVPAGWRDIRKLPENQRSTVPVITVDDAVFQKLVGRTRNGEEQSNGRSRITKNGRNGG